ncbi:helix-turn-helix transcriptional regulator [Actinoplanes sp. NPDC049548]|uniref:helix-turn-helix domain-containing protein n=1 Tax=Actinoplanes sp. NPDC049548 TaxID=3155152 RepID=UPI00341E9051
MIVQGETETSFGEELRRLRDARGMSLADLAREVHFDRGHLSKVERSLRGPSVALARACDSALGAEGRLVELAGSVQPSPAQADDLPPAWALEDSPCAVQFHRIAASATPFTNHHEQTAAEARDLYDKLRGHGHAGAPSSLVPLLAAQFGLLRAAVSTARPPVRDRLVLLAAHYAEYAGWMVQECGDDAGALALTRVAATLAASVADGEQGTAAAALRAYTNLRMADVALYRGNGKAVVTLAERTEFVADATTAVRTLAAQRAAQGWALLGRSRECLSALDRADEYAAHEAPHGAGIRLGSSGGGRLREIVRGWCLLDLGRSEDAAALLTAGLAAAPADAHRARALYGVRLSMSYATIGDLQGAWESAGTALARARRVDSAAVRHELRTFGALLRRRRRTNRSIADLQARIDRELFREHHSLRT